MATIKSTQRVTDAVSQSNMITVAFMDALGLNDWYNTARTREEVAEAIKNAIGSGGTIVVDSELSTSSTNPVQNKVITNTLNEKLDVMFEAPTQDNDNDKLAFVVLTEQPSQKYKGYVYAIQIEGGTYSLSYGDEELQEKLVSGVNLKTVGGESLLGAGNISRVPLADNLYSADSQTDVSEFIERTSGGDVSIETGEATLVRMEGVSTTPTHIAQELTFGHTETPRLSGSVDLETWQSSPLGTMSGSYTFSYDDTQESWTLNGEAVDLLTYGIVISGTPIAGDRIVIDYTYDDADPTQSTIEASITEGNRIGVVLEVNTWKSYVQSSGEYEFTYDGSNWKLGGGLQAFTVGQILSTGDKIHFDTSKGNQLKSYIETLDYQPGQGSYTLFNTSGEISLSASDMSIIAGINDCYVVAFGNSLTYEMTIIYATKAGSYGGITWTEGFQNLDSNGDYTLSLANDARIEENYIHDTTPPTWNGVIIGIGTSATTVDLADYGITVTGTPISGDEIDVHYVKEDFGTILNATPSTFRSVGFNLYNNANGFARVVGSEDGQWYNIKGTYTKIEFATTQAGPFTEITPENYTVGSYSTNSGFPIYEDGFIKVTGGNATDTMINLIWSGYMIDAEYQAYTEDKITIPTQDINSQTLPTELCQIGQTRDVINFDILTWVKKISKVAYTSATLENLLAQHPTWVEGTDYEWDNNYIYYVDTPTTYNLSPSLSGIYKVDDFGIEFITGTDIPVRCAILYGQNLKDKLRRDVLTIGPQTLTPEQQQQVWQNLGIEPIGNTQF